MTTQRATARKATTRPAKPAPEPEPEAPAKQPPPARITINLDDLERDPAEVKEPFIFLHNGEWYQIMDPSEIDWQDLLIADRNPAYLFAKGLADKDKREQFFAEPMRGWKMEALMKRYRKHFGLPDPGDPDALPR
jgi:hypothetical protein